MSDGPYRSLPMSRSWKRLAEFSENENFGGDDVCAAAVRALGETLRTEVPAQVLKHLSGVFLEQQAGLFCDQRIEAIQAVRSLSAGHMIGKLLVDNAACVAEAGGFGEKGMVEVVERTLSAIGTRHARQIEEHYLRKGTVALTKRVLVRVQRAFDVADKSALARQLCGFESSTPMQSSRKYQGIDDGVPL